MGTSGTARGEHGGIAGAKESEVADRAQTNWRTVDEQVRQAAVAGEPLSMERIFQINERLGSGLANNDGVPGQLRTQGQNPIAGHSLPKTYIPGHQVSEMMGQFMNWHAHNKTSMHPIELAAQAYQRLVTYTSISRCQWSYLPDGHGLDFTEPRLAPATLQGDEVNVAVYGLLPVLGMDSVPADHAVSSVTQGVERTLSLMKGRQ